MLRWLALAIMACGSPSWIDAATVTTIPCTRLDLPNGTEVRDKTCSGGSALRIELQGSENGSAIVLPIPPSIKPGKYDVVLRLRFEPADALSEGFTLSVSDASRTFVQIEDPDPHAPDFRLWRLACTIQPHQHSPALRLTLQRPPGKQARTVAVLLDCLTLRPRETDVGIVGLRPGKVLYLPKDEATCTVTLGNASGITATRLLRASQIVDVDTVQAIGTKSITVKAHSLATSTFTWNVGTEQYGHEIRIEVLDGKGRVQDWESDYFNVADNVWKVAMRAAHGPHMTDPNSPHCPYKTPAMWQEFLAGFPDQIHASYGNFSETFAWAPDDAFDMTPTQASWISGQAGYQHVRSRLLDLNRVLNDNGVWPITYAKSAASGPPSFEYMRRHPEFGLSRYQAQFDQQKIRDWNQQIPGQDKTIFYNWMSLVMDITNPRIVDAGVNEILDSAEMFGWRGARYDDHYTLWGRPYDPVSTANMQRIFTIGHARKPDFVWGFNYLTHATSCVWPGPPLGDAAWTQTGADRDLPADPHEPRWDSMPEPFPELKVAASNGAYFMNEEARGANGGTYSAYTRLLVHEARYIRNLGGHYGPIPFDARPASTFDAIYPDLLRAASRAHTYGDIYGHRALRQFLTRYSALIYGIDLAPIPDPEAQLRVTAKAGIWWHLFAYTCVHDGTTRVLVHLLGPPRNDRINQNTDGVAVTIADVGVTYQGPLEVARAWELSPFIDGFIRPLSCVHKTGNPSAFHLWTMVLFELREPPK